MAEPLLDAEYLARHAARRDGSSPVEMTFELTAPTPEPTPESEPPAPEAAAPAAPSAEAGEAATVSADAKSALEELLRKFGITQPLGETGFLEGVAKSANLGDLVTRMVRGLDLGLQIVTAPMVGAGTAAGDINQFAFSMPAHSRTHSCKRHLLTNNQIRTAAHNRNWRALANRNRAQAQSICFRMWC